MSKRSKKHANRPARTFQEICADHRLKAAQAFERAADYARKAFGQRIKVSVVRDHVRQYLNRGKLPAYVRQWITHMQAQPA